LSLVQSGNKIEAIKLLRQEKGCGLQEAVNAIEALAGGKTAMPLSQDANSLEGQIVVLMQRQQKIEAIKLYRQKTGAGLKESKDAVEAMAVKNGVNPKPAGCAGAAVLMIVVCMIIGRWILLG
jgi:ribosomal protein L7/L12